MQSGFDERVYTLKRKRLYVFTFDEVNLLTESF